MELNLQKINDYIQNTKSVARTYAAPVVAGLMMTSCINNELHIGDNVYCNGDNNSVFLGVDYHSHKKSCYDPCKPCAPEKKKTTPGKKKSVPKKTIPAAPVKVVPVIPSPAQKELDSLIKVRDSLLEEIATDDCNEGPIKVRVDHSQIIDFNSNYKKN